MSDKITGSLQENLLSLMIFNDKAASIIFNTIEPGLFESDFYKEIIRVALDYYKTYKEAPKDHIADILESKIQDSKNPKSGELYTKLLTNLYQTKDSINEDFVLSQLNNFVRRQRLKGAIIEAALLIKDETNESLVIAENTLNKCLKSQIQVFERGLSFSEPQKILNALREKILPPYPYGIKQLEDQQIGPAPGELFIFLASVSRGKSWQLINIGRHCLQDRKKVLHITLEMPEVQVAQRYLQCMYSLSSHATQATQIVQINTFNHDELGRLSSLSVKELERPSVKDSATLNAVGKKMERYKSRQPLEIRGFPTGSLSIEGLEVFLDNLDRLYNYTPDVLLLDYADLLKLDYKNLRTSTGEIYKELRRIAVERNIAMVTASQANRMAEDAKVITLKHLAEDYSKAATADTVIAFCQTSQEKTLGLARLFVAKARGQESGQMVLISQAYALGQFCMDSTIINDRYWTMLEQPSDGAESAATPAQRPRFRPRNKSDDS